MNTVDLDKFELVPVSSAEVEELQPFEDEYVYDLEVDSEDHTFIANGILVHNSLYITMDNILKNLFGTTEVDWDNDEVLEKIKNFVDGPVQNALNNHVSEFVQKKFKTPTQRIEFKREKISSEGEYLAKKRYVLRVRDSEGVLTGPNTFAYTGVDIVKNELSEHCKDILKNITNSMIKDHLIGDDQIKKISVEVYQNFIKESPDNLAFIKNLTTPKLNTNRINPMTGMKYSNDEFFKENFLKNSKGAGVHARAAKAYNDIIKLLGLNNKYEHINQGDRFKYIYLNKSNVFKLDCIAWKDHYPDEFKEIFTVDYNKMFDKTIQGPLRQFLINHKASAFSSTDLTMSSGSKKKSLFDL